jgi:adenylosuccinate lyase
VRHAGGILHNLATDIWTYIATLHAARHERRGERREQARRDLEVRLGVLEPDRVDLVRHGRGPGRARDMQRDLTDSTTQRNIGVAFGHSLLALDNLQRGLKAFSSAYGSVICERPATISARTTV